MEKLRNAATRYDHLIPWFLLFLVVAATAVLLQILIVKLLR